MIRPVVFSLGVLLVAAPTLPAQSPNFEISRGVSELEAAAHRDSNDAVAHYNLAIGYWNRERFDEAETQFRLSMQLDPDFAPPFLGLFAMTYARWPELWKFKPDVPADVLKKEEEVDRMFRHALVTDPLVDLRPLGAARPPVSPFVFLIPELHAQYDEFYRGFDDLDDGKYQSAFNVLSRLIKAVPRRDSVPTSILLWRGIAAMHVQQDSAARSDFERLVGRATAAAQSDSLIHYPMQLADYEYLLALELYRLGDGPGAVKHFHEALVADAGLYVAHTKLATIAEAGEDWDDAIAERRAAADVNPDDSHLLVFLAATLLHAGKAAEAEAPLRQAVSQDPRDFQAQFVLGVVGMRLSKNAEARTALTAALAGIPSRFQAMRDDAAKRLASLPP